MQLKCLVCSKEMKGRSDKKFCSINCKNQFHRDLKEQTNSVVQEIDEILHRNYEICIKLMKMEKNKKISFPRLTLEKMGFNFNYYTSTYVNSQKKQLHYVYDYAWMEFSSRDIMLYRYKYKPTSK